MTLLTRIREHLVVRSVGFTVGMMAVLLAAAVVATLTIDLGPAVRREAEEQGSKYIERPLHIGALSIHVLTGKVIVEDLRKMIWGGSC